eukprot:8617392-Prorocentrum_lima.AAC.1
MRVNPIIAVRRADARRGSGGQICSTFVVVPARRFDFGAVSTAGCAPLPSPIAVCSSGSSGANTSDSHGVSGLRSSSPVSYTHLTLPTICSV